MPILNRKPAPWHDGFADQRLDTRADAAPARRNGPPQGFRPGILEACSNPSCRSGWLHLWRSRFAPVFEGGWCCSAECTGERIRAAARRELDGRGNGTEKHRHRVPLGLLMMEQGWITAAQLKGALEAQKGSGAGRLGQWLVRQQGVSERLVTRALSLQWSCPVLPLEFHDAAALTPLMPRLFVDAFRALPLRVAAGKLVYLGFEDRLDPVLALAVERMSGLRAESGLVQGSQFQPAHERMLSAMYPQTELLEAASEPILVRALTRAVERARPVEACLVRVHEFLWLRMWNKAQSGPLPEPGSVQDVIGTIGDS